VTIPSVAKAWLLLIYIGVYTDTACETAFGLTPFFLIHDSFGVDTSGTSTSFHSRRLVDKDVSNII